MFTFFKLEEIWVLLSRIRTKEGMDYEFVKCAYAENLNVFERTFDEFKRLG